MTDEERKALIDELRVNDREIYLPVLGKAADQIEADGQRIAELEREVERRTYDGIHTCHDECQRVACVQRRRIAELEAALALADAALRGANMNMNVVERKVRAALGETK